MVLNKYKNLAVERKIVLYLALYFYIILFNLIWCLNYTAKQNNWLFKKTTDH